MESTLVDSPNQTSNLIDGRQFAFLSHVDFNLYRFRLPIMEALLARRAKVRAICPKGDYSARLEKHGIEHTHFDFNRTTFNPLSVRRSIANLHELLEKIKPDVLHTFTLRPNAYGASAGRRAGIPIIINTVTGLGSLHAADLGIKGRIAKAGVNWYTKSTHKHSTAVVFQNPDDMSYYLNKGMVRSYQARLIIGSGVDTEIFSPEIVSQDTQQKLREEWGIAEHDLVVTMIARLLIPKGVREYIEAAAKLQDRAKFVMIGDPDFGNSASLTTEDLKELVEAGRIIAPGHQENIPEWLSISDIYALPSYREGLPRTVLEAMAMGLPIVTTDVPGCRETVRNGENGYLVPAENAMALRNAISQLLEDGDIRAKMGACSRARAVNEFSNKVVLGQYLELYEELIQASKLAQA